MIILSELTLTGHTVFLSLLAMMFLLFFSIFMMVFYITKKQLTEQIMALTQEKEQLLAKLAKHE